MLNLLSSELFRLRKRPQTWLLLGIAFLLTALVYGGFVIGSRVTSGQDRLDMREVRAWERFREPQIMAGLDVFAAICRTYRIRDVVGHDMVAVPEGRKLDPGPAFPMGVFLTWLREMA